MENDKQTKCAHCQGSGTCGSGHDGCSCLICAKKTYVIPFIHKTKSMENHKGLICSSCHGSGEFDPMTKRLLQRITPVLAITIVYFALFLILEFGKTDNEHFTEVLAFSSTLIGSITGYYFAGKKNEKP